MGVIGNVASLGKFCSERYIIRWNSGLPDSCLALRQIGLQQDCPKITLGAYPDADNTEIGDPRHRIDQWIKQLLLFEIIPKGQYLFEKVLAKLVYATKFKWFNTKLYQNMSCKLFATTSLIVSAFVVSACDSGYSAMAPKETNVLGIIKHEPESYLHTGPNTFAIQTDELYARKEFSGDKTSLLWGLVTIKDY